ncbi:MAG: nucleoside triphosphate pyrophosphatase [Candidatus Omnitrophota bacterium]
MMKEEIILASSSERRSRILSESGIRHRVVPADVEETKDSSRHISETVMINAVMKAEAVAALNANAVVIGADTLVAHGKDIIGKPADEKEAFETLRRFSGSRIEVFTGLAVIRSSAGKKAEGFEKSALNITTLTDERIRRYFKLLVPYDKAGGFSIEGIGSLIFDDIEGSYFNILGLPMARLSTLFTQVGLDILDYVHTSP